MNSVFHNKGLSSNNILDENVKLSKKCEQRILTLFKHFIDFPLTLSGFEYSYTLHETLSPKCVRNTFVTFPIRLKFFFH